MALVTNRRRGVTNRAGRVFERFTINVGGDGVQAEEVDLEGRKHLKVPVVIYVEGVLNGSHGPGFYPADENGKNVDRWNHMPITLDHPTIKGKRVSARQAKIINRFKVGVLLDMKQDGKKTKGFAYFDKQRTKELDARVLNRISKGKKVEVSTGLHLTQELKSGVYNEEKYDWIARDHEPDHLAVLLDSVGASSVSKGAGLLANEQGLPASMSQILRRSVEEVVKLVGVEKVVGNEMSFSAVSTQLSRALAAAYGRPGEYWRGYVCEVFPDYVVYGDEDGKLYQVGYKTTKTTVELTGDPVEVSRQVSYVPVSNSTPREGDMAFDKKKHIDGLIGNGWDEEDRPDLEKMSDKALQKVLPKTPVGNATPPPPPPTVTVDTDKGKVKLTWAEIEEVMPPDYKAVHNFGKETINGLRKQAIEKVSKSKGNKLTEQQLANLPTDVLTNMAAMVGGEETKDDDTSGDVFGNGFVPSPWGTTPAGGINLGATPPPPPEKETTVANAAVTNRVPGPKKWDYSKNGK